VLQDVAEFSYGDKAERPARRRSKLSPTVCAQRPSAHRAIVPRQPEHVNTRLSLRSDHCRIVTPRRVASMVASRFAFRPEKKRRTRSRKLSVNVSHRNGLQQMANIPWLIDLISTVFGVLCSSSGWHDRLLTLDRKIVLISVDLPRPEPPGNKQHGLAATQVTCYIPCQVIC